MGIFSYRVSRQFSCSSELLCSIVLDVEKYKEFLSWCSGARLLSTTEPKDFSDSKDGFKVIKFFEAELDLGYLAFKGSLHSDIVVYSKDLGNGRKTMMVEAVSVKYPFEFIKSTFKFTDNNHGCLFEFFTDFKIKNIIIASLIKRNFPKVSNKVIDDFGKRAVLINSNNNLN